MAYHIRILHRSKFNFFSFLLNIQLVASVKSANSTGLVFNSTALDLDASNSSTLTTVDERTTPSVGYLPESWAKFCTTSELFVKWNFTTLSKSEVENLLQISCSFTPGMFFNLSDFRTWENRQLDGNKVAIKAKCGGVNELAAGLWGGFMAIWPMKVLNLVYLEISNCMLPGFLSCTFLESFTMFPDQLRVLEITNCITLYAQRSDLEVSSMKTTITGECLCGPITLEKKLLSRIKVNFIPEGKLSPIKTFYAGNPLYKRVSADFIDRQPLVCQYDNLKYLQEQDFEEEQVLSTMIKSVFPVLKVYNLSESGLENVPEMLMEWRAVFPKLDNLDLSYNHISHFQFFDQGIREDGIGTINLQHNSISVLTKRDLENFNVLKSTVLDIRNNPMDCSCGLLIDLYKYIQSPNLGSYEYLRELKCASPPSLMNRTLGSLTEIEIQCKEQLTFVPIVVLGVIVFVLLVAIFVTIKYRREVTILVYTRLHIVLPCRPADTEEDKDYDAFISYSSRDDDWVLSTLVRRLETEQDRSHAPLKLCVHHRDFEVGAPISENIVKSVESSRHTILVLSRYFVQSEWCIYEFRTALYQSLLDRKKHLIVVILEDVPKAELDTDLRKCLETFTYISITDILFWDKLVYALTIGKTRKSKKSKRDKRDNLQLKSQNLETTC